MGCWAKGRVVPGTGALAVLSIVLVAPRLSWAAVTLTAARTELLYSSTADPDCSELSKQQDDTSLPLNVIRLRATVEGASSENIRYRWSVPKGMPGTLAADLDIAADDPSIAGLCAEFGNACVLAGEKLALYNRPTILLLAPTCDILPQNTSRRFRGGVMNVRLRASERSNGRRRNLGKSAIRVGFGRTASVTLYANPNRTARSAPTDGIGQRRPIGSSLGPDFGALIDPGGQALPPVSSVVFETGDGQTSSVDPTACVLGNSSLVFDACQTSFLYSRAGRVTPAVRVEFEDGSALCDNISLRILSAINVIRLSVRLTPRRQTYTSGDQVRVQVVARNVSDPETGSGILLTGAGVLTCEESFALGEAKESKTTTFDLQHCSATSQQACLTNAHCDPLFCTECQQNETCLTESHCSTTLTQACSRDSDCAKKNCAECTEGERCVQVLGVPAIVIPVRGSAVLIDKTTTLVNLFPDAARMRDVWTVNPFNADADEVTVRYRIRGRPPVSAATRARPRP